MWRYTDVKKSGHFRTIIHERKNQEPCAFKKLVKRQEKKLVWVETWSKQRLRSENDNSFLCPAKKYHNNHRISERIKQFNNKRRRRQIKTKKKNVFEEEFASSRLQILTTLQRHKYRLHFHPRTIPLHKITKGGQFKALWYPKWQMSKVLLAGQESLLLCQVSYRTKFCEKKNYRQ